MVIPSQKFIIMQARFSNASGTEKMDEVVKSIKKVLTKYGLEMDDNEIRAIAQEVYENINISQTQRITCYNNSYYNQNYSP